MMIIVVCKIVPAPLRERWGEGSVAVACHSIQVIEGQEIAV